MGSKSIFARNSNKKKTIAIILIVLILFSAWMIWGNFTIKDTTIIISDKNLPEQFDGYKIALISDLHNAELGRNNSRIIKNIGKRKAEYSSDYRRYNRFKSYKY